MSELPQNAGLMDVLDAQSRMHPHYTHFQLPDKYYYPAQEFEQQTGLSGIARDYALPDGKAPVEVFLDVFRHEVQLRMLEGYLDAPLEKLDAWHAQNTADLAAFRQQVTEEIPDMPFEELVADMAEWHDIGFREATSRGLMELRDRFGSIEKNALEQAKKQVQANFEAAVEQTYQRIEALNPALKPLGEEISSHDQRWDVVNGVLSKFNIPDIQSFSINGFNGPAAEKDPAWVARQKQVEQAAGQGTKWIPAPSTQFRILQQARQRDTLDAAMGR